MTVTIPIKNPRKIEAARTAARARWGPGPRVLRIDSLPPAYRQAVLALLDAAKKAGEPSG